MKEKLGDRPIKDLPTARAHDTQLTVRMLSKSLLQTTSQIWGTPATFQWPKSSTPQGSLTGTPLPHASMVRAQQELRTCFKQLEAWILTLSSHLIKLVPSLQFNSLSLFNVESNRTRSHGPRGVLEIQRCHCQQVWRERVLLKLEHDS